MTETDAHTERQRALDAIRRELEAMGESTPTQAELAQLLDDRGDEPEPVAFVGRLVDVSRGPAAQLDEVTARRAWSTVEARAGRASMTASRPAARPSWVPVLVGLVAVAAAVGLAFIVLPGDDGPGTSDHGPAVAERDPDAPAVDAVELEALSAQARAGLLAVGVDDQSASRRARAMRAQYREALGVPTEEGAG